MSEATNELSRRYRMARENLRAHVKARLEALYAETIDPDNLDESFAAFIPPAAELVQAGQNVGVSLATAYLGALVTLNALRRPNFSVPELAPLTGMDAWPSMVKAQIGKGVEVEQAVEYGRYLADRFADNEVTAAVDRHTDRVTRSGEFSGWTGITVGETCDPCRANEGFHALDEPFYRHPGCDCTREYLVAI